MRNRLAILLLLVSCLAGLFTVNSQGRAEVPGSAEPDSVQSLLEVDTGLTVAATALDAPWFNGAWYRVAASLGPYGSKYAGGLGTYSAKHRPMAIYDVHSETTFFVFGANDVPEGALRVMVSSYSHTTDSYAKPTLLLQRPNSNAHRNPTIEQTPDGHIWVFASAHGDSDGRIFRSIEPRSVMGFDEVSSAEFTYPQPHVVRGDLSLVHTRYTAGREIYVSEVSRDGLLPPRKLIGFGGHYAVTETTDDMIGIAFNRHPGGDVDHRENLYYAWYDPRSGRLFDSDMDRLPDTLDSHRDAPLVRESPPGERVYLKDLDFTPDGRPVILYVTSPDWRPGPLQNGVRTLRVAEWTGAVWEIHDIGPVDHNYDTGSLRAIQPHGWLLVYPIKGGQFPYGTGGEPISSLLDESFRIIASVSIGGDLASVHHSYIRDVRRGTDTFSFFSATGNPFTPSLSRLARWSIDRSEVK